MQRDFWPLDPVRLPHSVTQYLSKEEIILSESMPTGEDFGKMLAWLRRRPVVIRFFITETRAIIRETPNACIQIEEVICRVRRRHGVKISNHKGWFARWLPRLVPEIKIKRRSSRFDSVMNHWKGGKPRD